MKENRDTAIRSADIDLGFFDLNYASEEQIAEIPGIGAELARAIVQHRPYTRIEELAEKVPNFTQDNFDELTRAGASVGQPMKDKREFEDAR
jgi:radical SAM superfamily enzyme with C-terminal helix-hairpin-helix motif